MTFCTHIRFTPITRMDSRTNGKKNTRTTEQTEQAGKKIQGQRNKQSKRKKNTRTTEQTEQTEKNNAMTTEQIEQAGKINSNKMGEDKKITGFVMKNDLRVLVSSWQAPQA